MSTETRETILFLAGLAGFAYVLLVPSAPKDISILLMLAGMMGVPAVLPMDRRRREGLRETPPDHDPMDPHLGDSGAGSPDR